MPAPASDARADAMRAPLVPQRHEHDLHGRPFREPESGPQVEQRDRLHARLGTAEPQIEHAFGRDLPVEHGDFVTLVGDREAVAGRQHCEERKTVLGHVNARYTIRFELDGGVAIRQN